MVRLVIETFTHAISCLFSAFVGMAEFMETLFWRDSLPEYPAWFLMLRARIPIGLNFSALTVPIVESFTKRQLHRRLGHHAGWLAVYKPLGC